MLPTCRHLAGDARAAAQLQLLLEPPPPLRIDLMAICVSRCVLPFALFHIGAAPSEAKITFQLAASRGAA